MTFSDYLFFETINYLSLKGTTFYECTPGMHGLFPTVHASKILRKRRRMTVKLFFWCRKRTEAKLQETSSGGFLPVELTRTRIHFACFFCPRAWHSSGIPRSGEPQTSINVIWIFQAPIRGATAFSAYLPFYELFFRYTVEYNGKIPMNISYAEYLSDSFARDTVRRDYLLFARFFISQKKLK